MNSSFDLKTRLKEACIMTGACWAARLCRDQNIWTILTVVNLSESGSETLQSLLMGEKFLSWIGLSPLNKRTKTTILSNDFDLDGSRLYAFPVTPQEIILIGVYNTMDIKTRRLWNYVANIERMVLSFSGDKEISNLQNTVLDLELTRQELQARINAQRDAEARVIQSAKLAAVGEMAAGVAHELNNPLTSVIGFTELVLEDLPQQGSRARADLELVLQEAKRARSVVRNLLDFARQSETVRVKTDINEIVDDVLMLTRHLMHSSNVLIEIHLIKNLRWVTVDRNQIKQVVINLINNALYAMPNGGRIIIETSEQTRYSRPWIRLSISDNGVGIPQDNLERIFEPFFTTRADHGGTGLGLSVTYGIVTDHGGMIEVESQINRGSRFDVWLPLDIAE